VNQSSLRSWPTFDQTGAGDPSHVFGNALYDLSDLVILGSIVKNLGCSSSNAYHIKHPSPEAGQLNSTPIMGKCIWNKRAERFGAA
jgi:hypothetical protein